jgi:hypothetical protein
MKLTVSSVEMKKFQKIIENADFDVGHGDMSQTNSIGGKDGLETTNRGRADIKNRRTNARYGDNTMTGKLEEFDNSGILDRLHNILLKAGISDDEIRAGIDLTPKGTHKVAGQLGVPASEISMLMGSLNTRMRDDESHEESAFESAYYKMMEDDGDDADTNDRFGYEKDGMGNVTVRDSQTGKSTYIQGSQATDLLNSLQQSPDNEQSILGDLQPLMENSEEREPDFLDEMKQTHGTMNFPWTTEEGHGTGTVSYNFSGHDLKLRLLSVRDNNGKIISPDPAMKAKLEKIAHDFIENE